FGCLNSINGANAANRAAAFGYGCAAPGCGSCGTGNGLLASTNTADNEVTEGFSYDQADRLSGSTMISKVFGATGTVQTNWQKTIGYDAAGNRKTLKLLRTDTNGEIDFTYGYDELNRLTAQTDWQGRTFTYEYDELFRRTKLTRPNGVYTT